MSKPIKIIFTISFLLNLVLLGVVGGGFYKKHHWQPDLQVSQNTKDVFKKNKLENKKNMKAHFQEMRGLKADLKKIITAEEFDQSAYEEKMEEITGVKEKLEQSKTQALGKTLSSLSQAEREEFSKHVMRHLSDKKHGKRRHRGGASKPPMKKFEE